ncbi:hypothetical protein PG993_010757 [Apiospora rasikravindrae]|uniref:Uncharacterized protein n=1 Tax=Apiospora rasikravindrae TaxID=990691 RepID=A0ABR1SCA0_9PEZI
MVVPSAIAYGEKGGSPCRLSSVVIVLANHKAILPTMPKAVHLGTPSSVNWWLLDEGQLHEAARTSGVSHEALLSSGLDFPRLDFPAGFRLKCLRGRHRAKAAQEAFRSNDKRWVVDLFAADITDETTRDLAENYVNERKLDDGEFYYKIREYQGIFGVENPYFERIWWARLASTSKSMNKKDRLEQLFAHRKFAPAFDAFRPLKALYAGLRLSVMNKIISMGCDDEHISSLRDIKNWWYLVFDQREDAMQQLEKEDVLAVQCTAPGACRADADRLFGRVRDGEIFRMFDEAERLMLWSRICSASADRLVPSLYGFFENCKYIQPAADCMKRLVHLEKRETIRSAMENAFWGPGLPDDASTCMIQVSTSSFKLVPANQADRFDLLYRQLWLYALREYPAMPAERSKKLAGPKGETADENMLFDFAHMAHIAGFRTPEIDHLLQQDPDRDRARRLLMTARKPGHYEYDDLETRVTQVVDIMTTAQPVSYEEGADDWSVEEQMKPPNRCGIPAWGDHSRDRTMMFLEKLHAPIESQGSCLTSFFVQRSTYFSFFKRDIGIDLGNLGGLPTVDLRAHRSPSQRRPATDQPPNVYGHQRSPELTQQPSRSAELARNERACEARLEDLRRRTQEEESRLQLIMERQQQQRAEIENLQSTHEAKLEEAHEEEQTIRATLANLRSEEGRQILQLEKLKVEEREKLDKIGQLEQAQRALNDQMQLESPRHLAELNKQQRERVEQLARDERECSGRLEHLRRQLQEQEGKTRMHQKKELSRQREDAEAYRAQHQAMVLEAQMKMQKFEAEEKAHRENLDQLAASELQKQTSIDFLNAEQQRLQSAVEELSAEVDKLTENEGLRGARITQLAARENELRGVVDKLRAKELALRQTVDQLAICQEQLGAKINRIAAEGNKHRPSVESVQSTGIESQALIDISGAKGTGLQPVVADQPLDRELQDPGVREGFTMASAVRGESRRRPDQDGFPSNGVADQPRRDPEELRRTARSTDALTHRASGNVSKVSETAGAGPSTQVDGPAHPRFVRIEFKTRVRGEWVVSHELLVDPLEPSQAMRVAAKYLRKDVGIFDSRNRMLSPINCYEKVTSDGTNAIYLVPNWEAEGGSLVRLGDVERGEPAVHYKRSRQMRIQF